MASPAGPLPFIKNLASSDKKLRTQALDSLKAFLTTKYSATSSSSGSSSSSTSSARPPLTFDDAEKLWAGLFYAVWMADKPRVQQRLCDELAALPSAAALTDASTAAWLRGFWSTMARKWTTGIDVLRMDKFLLLVRRVLAAQMAWMIETDESQTLGLQVLETYPLNPDAEAPLEGKTTLHIPVGLAIHVTDIWVDETLRAVEASDDRDDDQLLRQVHGLVETLASRTGFPAVRKRARESLQDERLPWIASAKRRAEEEAAAAAEAEAAAVAKAAAETETAQAQTTKTTTKSSAKGSGAFEGLADDDDDNMADDASWDGFND